MTATEWAFNSKRLQIELGITGDAQEGGFMNATLQSAGSLEFSVAVHVNVPEQINTEEALADYLGGIFGQIAHDHPELEVQIQLGPAGDGEARDSGWDEPTGYCTDHGSYDPAGNCSGCEEEEDLH